jgi:2'-5' RNA ligase
MPFAINIKTTDASAAPLLGLTAEYRLLKASPTSVPSNYPPHITLAIYDNIPFADLRDALRHVFSGQPALHLRFTRIATFEQPSLVFWAAPELSEALNRAHASLHRLIDPALCHEHYRPNTWAPHCTLAMSLPSQAVSEARALAARTMQPFDVKFETADCVEFHPIQVIEECTLVPI